jgi:outer membrane protein TolC
VDKLSVDLSMSERYPAFRLGGGLETRDGDDDRQQSNWNAVLSMSIPLFDGFSSWARVKESRYRAEQGRLRRVQLEDQVEVEIREAVGDFQHWSEEVESRQRELASVDSRRSRYFGAGQSEPLRARLDYLEWAVNAEVDVVDARYEKCLAAVRIAKAAGRSLQDKKGYEQTP